MYYQIISVGFINWLKLKLYDLYELLFGNHYINTEKIILSSMPYISGNYSVCSAVSACETINIKANVNKGVDIL